MEGIQTIQALKAVQSSLPAQTTIPSDELVMLYAADGTPIAKIARDDLVKAVASVMASNSQTTFSKLLGVQANGTPMGIGASDLASVLGVPVAAGWGQAQTANINTLSRNGFYWAQNSAVGYPDNLGGTAVIVHWRQDYGSGAYGLQILMGLNSDKIFIRQAAAENSWESWKQIQFVA